MLNVEFKTMGCLARAVVDAEGSKAQAALDWLPRWFARRERILSRFDPRSDLASLNTVGSAERVDRVLWAAIEVALRAAAETDGLVTPTILPALEASGYDRTFEEVDRDQVDPIRGIGPAADWRRIECDPISGAVKLPVGVRLDLGGTVKGWCADLAASYLGRLGPALVDVGGDIAVRGAGTVPYPIAVEDPRGGGSQLDLVTLSGGGIATSGRDFRRWKRAGVEQHHLIDPRTGAPARTDVLTVSVVATCALDAEIAAKRVLLEGSAAGMAWLETRADLAALVVREDGGVDRSTRFERYRWRDAA